MAKRKRTLLNMLESLVVGGCKESESERLSESGAEPAKCRRRLRACVRVGGVSGEWSVGQQLVSEREDVVGVKERRGLRSLFMYAKGLKRKGLEDNNVVSVGGGVVSWGPSLCQSAQGTDRKQ